MCMTYRDVLNRIALNQLAHVPSMPDASLMVGITERLSRMPVEIPQHKIPREVAENLTELDTLSNDQIKAAIHAGTLSINDYNGNTAILAGMIGGAKS